MVLVNGTPASAISTSDRGLNYGDGLFETMVVIDGRVRFFSDHLERLRVGCETLALPEPKRASIEADLAKLTAAQENSTFVFKVLITRGETGRGYLPSKDVSTTRVSSSHVLPAVISEHWQHGLSVHLCATRLATNPAFAGIKHTNRLEQVMASLERVDTEFDEGLVLSMDDYVVEGTKSNIFWQTDGEFYTPSLEDCGVAGVIRAKLIELLERDNHKVNVGKYGSADLHAAGLVFMTNSTMLIAQVTQLEKTVWQKSSLIQELRQTLASEQ